MKEYISPEIQTLYFNSRESITLSGEAGSDPKEILNKEIRGENETPILWD